MRTNFMVLKRYYKYYTDSLNSYVVLEIKLYKKKTLVRREKVVNFQHFLSLKHRGNKK